MNWEIWDGFLQKDFQVVHQHSWNRIEQIHTVQIAGGTETEEPGTICLCCDRQLVEQAGTHGLYIATEKEVRQKEDLPGYYLVSKTENKEQTVNQILRLFMQGQQWMYQIHEAAYVKQDMQELINLLGTYWQISALIVNSAYEISERIDMPDQTFRWDNTCDSSGRMTEEAIENLYLDTPEFDKTFVSHGLQEYLVKDDETDRVYVSYYYNFMDETDVYQGRILFACFTEPLSAEIQAVFSFAAKEAQHCFFTYGKHAAATKIQKELHHLFLQLIDGEMVRRAAVTVCLEQNGWHTGDTYTLYRLVSNGNMHAAHTLSYYCQLLEQRYRQLLTVEKDNGIYCLCHGMEGQAVFREQLPYFLREHLFIAGASNIFRDFFSINLYAREAAYALYMGMRCKAHLWVHEFSAYTLSYCVEKITEEYPAEELLHPGLKVLEEYDRQHPGSDLVLTLKQYMLQQFHATHAAESLHVHRTTLLYRLRRIQELTGLQLEDEDTLLHLQLSYALMER